MRCTVKIYGNDTYKIIYHKAENVPKLKPFDIDEFLYWANMENVGKQMEMEFYRQSELAAARMEKAACNISRTKGLVREYALCNPWQYFATLTLNADKQDRYDIDGYIKDLGVWIGNYNRKYGCKLKYMLIPEQHKDGAWHMHGLLNGVAETSVQPNTYGYLDMPYYTQRFGYISLDPVKDIKRCASYITKYVSKAMGATNVALGKHSFYHSSGLQKAEVLTEFYSSVIPDTAYQNDYCGVDWIDGDEELQKYLKGNKIDNVKEVNT